MSSPTQGKKTNALLIVCVFIFLVSTVSTGLLAYGLYLSSKTPTPANSSENLTIFTGVCFGLSLLVWTLSIIGIAKSRKIICTVIETKRISEAPLQPDRYGRDIRSSLPAVPLSTDETDGQAELAEKRAREAAERLRLAEKRAREAAERSRLAEERAREAEETEPLSYEGYEEYIEDEPEDNSGTTTTSRKTVKEGDTIKNLPEAISTTTKTTRKPVKVDNGKDCSYLEDKIKTGADFLLGKYKKYFKCTDTTQERTANFPSALKRVGGPNDL